MNAICKYCKKEIECKNESEISIVEKYGPYVMFHFDCLKENMKKECNCIERPVAK